jgi:hypothetical protein
MVAINMNEDRIAFAGGSLLSAVPAFQWLWPLQVDAIGAPDLAMIWLFKIGGTVILGFLGGLTGMVGKDFYRHLKRKLTKYESKNFDNRSNLRDSDSGNVSDL